jgi:hypothetical protein
MEHKLRDTISPRQSLKRFAQEYIEYGKRFHFEHPVKVDFPYDICKQISKRPAMNAIRIDRDVYGHTWITDGEDFISLNSISAESAEAIRAQMIRQFNKY